MPRLGGTASNSLPSLQDGCWRHLVAASDGRLYAQLCLQTWIWKAKGGVGRWGCQIWHRGFLNADSSVLKSRDSPYFFGLILPGVCACVAGGCCKHVWAQTQ